MSAGAPAWVSYAALLISAGALVVAFFAFRAGGPRLRLSAQRLPTRDEWGDPAPMVAPYRLSVVNAGRSAVSIQGFHVTPYGSRKTVAEVDRALGPPLPYRLEAHATETWVVDALQASRDYHRLLKEGLKPHSSWPSQFRFTVAAGHGKRASTRSTLDALQVIADSKPES